MTGSHAVAACSGLVLLLAGSAAVAGKKDRKEQEQLHGVTLPQREATAEELAIRTDAYVRSVEAELARLREVTLAALEHDYERHLETGEPFVRNLLLISGGGAKGAFAAGFLQGWASVEKGPLALPQFDVVTGVSTGALIAPFAFIGTEEAMMSVADLYANPAPNWVKKRGALFFLPKHPSLYNDRGLQDHLHEIIDLDFVRAVAARAEQNRILLIGATNLDIGVGRVFDLGTDAIAAEESGSVERVHDILLASSALPGIFPPVEIDDFLYVDGGASSQIFVLTALDNVPQLIETWKGRHPDSPLPAFRIWAIVNEPLGLETTLTQPHWPTIAARSLGVLMRESMLASLRLVQRIAEKARDEHGLDVEFRFVALPADAPKSAAHEMFQREHMVALEQMGRRMGADPASWRTEVPDLVWHPQEVVSVP